ncbi:MAG: zf-TFIIB domain-containing protein [Planctomycetes bacterium]|nr:zf-TFIIB domain-containing protein [Planctomycetota bacterium]
MLLVACPTCQRQYDVTGLEPGAAVRCVCDALLDVGWPRNLTGQALTCTNCGGAVRVEDESCPYCQARISEADRRRTTLCPKCYTRLEDDSKHCKSCGLEIRPQALTPLPADRGCPRCQGELRTRALEQADVIECAACLGIWLTPRTFDRTLLETERRSFVSALSLVEPPQPTRRELETVSYIPCLTCGQLMNRRQYRYADRSSGVVIDVCGHHGVWLDHQELEQIVAFVRAGGAGGPTSTQVAGKAFDAARVEELRARRKGGPQTPKDLLTAALEGVYALFTFDLFGG